MIDCKVHWDIFYRYDSHDLWRGVSIDRRHSKFFITAIVVTSVAARSDQGVST